MRKRQSKKIYQCRKIKTKKYLKRPSPPYSASECPNKIMKGNDGNMYISSSHLYGPFRWIRYSHSNTKRNTRQKYNKTYKHKTFT